MPNEVQTARVVIEPEVHIFPGQTQTLRALDAVDAEPPLTGVTPQQAQAEITEIQRGKAYTDPFHPDHAQAMARMTQLYRAKGADDDKPPAEATAEEEIAGFSNVEFDMIEAGANALLGEGGYKTIEADANIANDPDALKLLAELGQLEKDFPGASEGVRQHLHLTPAQAKHTIAEKRDDPKFLRAYNDNADFRHNASVGEMACLNLGARGGLLKWQAQAQQQPQS